MRVAACALLLIAIGTTSIYGCRDLPPLGEKTCGNAVIDEGEDCDSFPNGAGTICRAPGVEGECRFDCTPPIPAEPAEGPCPSGYVCNPYDTICHKPDGTFAAGPTVIAEGVQEIHLGDFDGDGRKDALTVSAAEQRVHFFDQLGQLVTRTDVQGALQKPGVGRLSGEGDLTDDFTNIAGIGLSVLRGQENRSVAPTQYEIGKINEQARYSIFAINSVPGNVGDEIMGLFQVEKDPSVTIRTANEKGVWASVGDILNIPGPLTGEAAVADLSPLPLNCDEAVVAFAFADHVTVISPCLGLPDKIQQDKIHLDGTGYVTSAVHIADMNGDSSPDIVFGGIGMTGGESCHFLAVAYNTGAGAFTSVPGSPANAKAAMYFDYFDANGSCNLNGAKLEDHIALRPIAAGDVNGDGVGDYVDPAGIHVAIPDLVTKTPKGFYAPISLPGTFWTTAVIADITADGIADVVAGNEIFPGIDFFQGTSLPAIPFNVTKIASEHPVAGMKVGYFDADLVRDVVFAEQKLLDPTEPPNSSGDELAVLFGRALAPPEPPTRFGRMSRIQQVLTADLPQLTKPESDLMTDLIVITGQEYPVNIDKPSPMAPEAPLMVESKSVLALPGNGERQLLSSFRLAPHKAAPIQTAVGQFFGEATSPDDVAVISTSESYGAELWLLPVQDDGLFAPFFNKDDPKPVASTASPINLPAIAGEGVVLSDKLLQLVVANLDAKGADEIVAFIPTTDVERPELYRIVARTKDVTTGDGTFMGWELDAATKLEELFYPLHIESADVNNDQLEDIVGVFLERPTKKNNLPPARIIVYLSDGTGFKPVPITAPRHVDPDPEFSFDDRPWTVSAVNIDTDFEKELAIFSTERMFIADFDATTGLYKDPYELMSVGGTVSAAGDITGDGIDDIAVSDGTNLQILVGGSP